MPGSSTDSVWRFNPDPRTVAARLTRCSSCRVAQKRPRQTFYSTKRLIGRQLNSVKHDSQKVWRRLTRAKCSMLQSACDSMHNCGCAAGICSRLR